MTSQIQTITANKLEFAYLSQGDGPLVLCLHGYPDDARTWEPTIAALAENGFRAVAPFMRGYYPTEIPANGSYSALDLGADALAIIKALGEETAFIIGHDWGALTAYAATNMKPEVVKKLVTVAIPHPRALRTSFRSLLKARHFITYQFRALAVRQLKRNKFAHIDAIYRRWSPDWDFAPEELASVKAGLAHPGRVEAALGYYWSFAAERGGERAKVVRKITAAKTSVPTLCIVGANDGALELSNMENTPRAFTGPYQYEIMPGAGHFLHREKPELFIKLVLDYLMGE